ncbi:hypothetical protein [Pseudomonas phage vB_PaeM_PS119XW]|uniref:Uncharacterized protein n=1 Tax=Pseudomonas phage vB_PaeM_PS119XW TaxID=2601632 RepID=A0A5C1K7P9_9CAUD|nr:hypothetical protein PP933_gp060 [Pseudomonas phage vB_PaeM_PS119XW]QEM41789.1 hypothetical protein [Pseudomonas phage vB_PaeM_PS119XW]
MSNLDSQMEEAQVLVDGESDVKSAPDLNETDALIQRVEHLNRTVERLSERLHVSEKAIKQILEALTQSEDLHELRVIKILSSFFGGLNNSLHESLEHMTQEVSTRRYGFTIEVVDGVNVTAHENSVIATKREDGGIDFASINTPDQIQNHGTEPFVQYLKQHDELFEGQNAIVINILASKDALEKVQGELNEPVSN